MSKKTLKKQYKITDELMASISPAPAEIEDPLERALFAHLREEQRQLLRPEDLARLERVRGERDRRDVLLLAARFGLQLIDDRPELLGFIDDESEARS